MRRPAAFGMVNECRFILFGLGRKRSMHLQAAWAARPNAIRNGLLFLDLGPAFPGHSAPMGVE